MVNEQELIELLRKCTVAAEQTVAAFEDGYEISDNLRRTIKKASELLKTLDQDKAIQED